MSISFEKDAEDMIKIEENKEDNKYTTFWLYKQIIQKTKLTAFTKCFSSKKINHKIISHLERQKGWIFVTKFKHKLSSTNWY